MALHPPATVAASFQQHPLCSRSSLSPPENCDSGGETYNLLRRPGETCVDSKEDLKSRQRMTHIAAERRRRKQMSDHIAQLRSLIPHPYLQRGDQASIIGGAINYIKQLQQVVQTLEAEKRTKTVGGSGSRSGSATPSGDSAGDGGEESRTTAATTSERKTVSGGATDVEVTVVESHVSLKVVTRRRPRQLCRMVAALHRLRLNVLHLNAAGVDDDLAVYYFNVKIEGDWKLTSGNEIAAAVHDIVGRL